MWLLRVSLPARAGSGTALALRCRVHLAGLGCLPHFEQPASHHAVQREPRVRTERRLLRLRRFPLSI